MEDIKKLQPRAFTRFCMSIGAVPSSYLAGLTIEEQLLWFCSYLQNEVIPAVNNNAGAVEELQALYTELKNYVDNYFDNLDVQEEINNKLDDMAESGELADIIAQFLNTQVVRYYESVSAMVSDTELESGNKVLVYDTDRLCYKNYAINETDTDGVHLSNGLYATIINHSIVELNIEDFSQYVVEGNWIPAFSKAFEYIYNSSPLHDALGIVNLGNAQYTCESTLTIPNRVIIDGHDCGGLVFTDDEHDYINFVTKDGIFIGNGGGIRNVTITGTATEPISTNNTSVSALTIGSEAAYGTTRGSLGYAIFDNIRIQNAPGNGLRINNYVGAMQVTNVCISNVGGIGFLLAHVTDSIFDNFRITGTRLAGLQLNNSTAQNKFSSFKIYACGLSGTDLGDCASVKMTYNSRNMFSNFECQDNGGAGVYMNHCDYNQFSNFLVDRSGVHVQAGNYYINNSNNNEGDIMSCNYTNTIDTYLGIYLSNSFYNKFNYISDDKQTSSDVDSGITNELYGNNKRHKYISKGFHYLSETVNLEDVPYDYLELTFTEDANNYNYARKVIIYKGCSLDVDNCFANATRMIRYVRPISLNATGTQLTLGNMFKYTISASGTTIVEQQATERSLFLKDIAYVKE